MNLGQFVATKDSSGVSSRNRQKKEAFVGSIWSTLWIWTGFARLSDVIALQIHTLKDGAPEFGHSHRLIRPEQTQHWQHQPPQSRTTAYIINMLSMEAKTNEGSSTTSDSAATINTASLYICFCVLLCIWSSLCPIVLISYQLPISSRWWWWKSDLVLHLLMLTMLCCILLSCVNASISFRVSFGGASRRTWCTCVTETKSVLLTRWQGTGVSPADCKNASMSACRRSVSTVY